MSVERLEGLDGRRFTHKTAGIRAWINARPEPFTVDDVPAELRPADRRKAVMLLNNLKAWSGLRSAGHGRYQRLEVLPAMKVVKVPLPVAAQRRLREAESNAAADPFGPVAVSIGRGLRRSFTLLDLAARCDGGERQAARWLNAWVSRGWAGPAAGFGQFQVMAGFGGGNNGGQP